MTIGRDRVLQRLIQLAADTVEADPATVSPGMRLIADLGFDSLDVAEYVMLLEEEFDVQISDDQAVIDRTIIEVFDLVWPMICERTSGASA